MALGNSARAIAQSRHGIRNVLDKRDDQLNAIIGPCSIHDPPAVLEYARWLAEQSSCQKFSAGQCARFRGSGL